MSLCDRKFNRRREIGKEEGKKNDASTKAPIRTKLWARVNREFFSRIIVQSENSQRRERDVESSI